MIGRAGVLPAVVGAVLVLAAGCSQEGPSATPSGETAATPPSAPPANDVTTKDFCALVSADQLTGVAFPVTTGQPLNLGTSRACRFPASDRAGGPVPDSVMISALPGGAISAGEPVTVEGVAGSRILTKTECTLLLPTEGGGAVQILVARAGKGPQQCAIAESVAAVVMDQL